MKIETNRRFKYTVLLLAVGALALLPGCSSLSPEAPAQVTPRPASAIDNCGFTVELDVPPERVVTVKSTPLELLLALGQSSRIVGSAMLDGPVPQGLAPTGWEPNVLADQLPSREVLLAAEPDFVIAGWESNLGQDGLGTRTELLGLGINTYVAPPACAFGSESSDPLEFDDVFDMISEVGAMFDASSEAESIISDQRSRLEAIPKNDGTLSALWFSSGEDAPFVGGGTGTPSMIMRAAGLTNVAEPEAQSWFSMPWESFVASDPDVIVLVDAPWNSAEKKRAVLEGHPAASSMRAVKEERFIVVDFATTEAGVRNIDAVESIANAAASQ